MKAPKASPLDWCVEPGLCESNQLGQTLLDPALDPAGFWDFEKLGTEKLRWCVNIGSRTPKLAPRPLS